MENNGTYTRLSEDIMHLSRLLFQRNARALEALDIGAGQIPILHALYESGSLSQREIADRIRVTPATISITIRKMERANLVVRRGSTADARVYTVHLTDAGRERFEEALYAMNLPYGEMLKGFSEEEVELFRSFICRMDENMTRFAERDG